MCVLHCTDEIWLKQSGSNKAALGNTAISFAKLLFSHASVEEGGELGGGGRRSRTAGAGDHCKSNAIIPP